MCDLSVIMPIYNVAALTTAPRMAVRSLWKNGKPKIRGS